MNFQRGFFRLFRYMAIMVYDGLILFGLALFVSLLAVIVTPRHEVQPETLWFQLLLLSAWIFYITFSLKVGGQTLGMKAWQVRWPGLQNKSWLTATLLVTACITGFITVTLVLIHLLV